MLWLTCGLHSDWSFLLQGWQFSLLLVFNHQKSTQYYLSHSLLWASNCLWWGKNVASYLAVPPIRPSLGFQVQFILHHIITLAPEWMIQSGSGEIQSWVRKCYSPSLNTLLHSWSPAPLFLRNAVFLVFKGNDKFCMVCDVSQQCHSPWHVWEMCKTSYIAPPEREALYQAGLQGCFLSDAYEGGGYP